MPSSLRLLTVAVILALSHTALTTIAADSAHPADKEAANPTNRIGSVVHILGLTLVDPSEALMKKHGLSADFPGPIITQVQDPSFFPKGTAPAPGCSFWIVEHPSKSLGLKEDKSPSFRPKTALEFAEAIIACTAAPADYEALLASTRKMARDQAAQLKDDPALRSRLLEISETRLSPAETGKYVCRLVYNYPDQQGTMTTQIYLSKAELDDIRKLLKK